jgi:ribose 5-phosphate isomerase B
MSSSSSTPQKPKRRAFFSLNVDSTADHIYERIEDYNKEKTDRVKVREQSGPLRGSTHLHVLGNPYEKEVQRSIERIVDGRVVRDTLTTYDHSDTNSPPRKKSIEDKYDTSDL